jgi:hypothetical protein
VTSPVREAGPVEAAGVELAAGGWLAGALLLVVAPPHAATTRARAASADEIRVSFVFI